MGNLSSERPRPRGQCPGQCPRESRQRFLEQLVSFPAAAWRLLDARSDSRRYRGEIKLGRGVAAMLVGSLAGERPVSGTCPVATVVISGGGAGDQSVGSPE